MCEGQEVIIGDLMWVPRVEHSALIVQHTPWPLLVI